MLNGSAPLPFVIPSVAEGSAVRPSDLPIFPSKLQPSNRRVIPTEVEGPAVPSIPITNVEWKRPSPLCHPERSRGICSAPLGPSNFSIQTPTLKQTCHPDRSGGTCCSIDSNNEC